MRVHIARAQATIKHRDRCAHPPSRYFIYAHVYNIKQTYRPSTAYMCERARAFLFKINIGVFPRRQVHHTISYTETIARVRRIHNAI